jgi:nucleoside-diphosphate-sugar epimerase
VNDERAAGRAYNVGEEDPPSWAEWVGGIGVSAGWDGEVVVVPDDRVPKHLDWGLDTEQHWVTDTGRIRRELGYAETVERDEALRRAVEWERAHPPENVDPTSFDYAAEDAALAAMSR